MTSPYLIADETVRAMALALRSLPCSRIASAPARAAAYWDADVSEQDASRHDAEAHRRELIRRRLFGLTFGSAALVATAQQAAAGDMEHITGNLVHDAMRLVAIMVVALFAGVGFFAFVWLLRHVSAAFSDSQSRHAAHIDRQTADDIWS